MENQQVGEHGDQKPRHPERRRRSTTKLPSTEGEVQFDRESGEDEIAPGKLRREKADDDRSGADPTKGHESYEFKAQPETPELSQGSNNLGVSGGAGGAQFGKGANLGNQAQRNGVGGGNDTVIEKKSQKKDQGGAPPVGSRNGSTGSSSQGTYDKSLRGSSGGIDGERSGKGSGINRGKQ